MKKTVQAFSFAILVFLGTLGLSAQPSSASAQGAQAFVQSISADVLKILNNSAYSDAEKETRLNGLFEKVVDIKWIGTFVAGRHWKGATPAQQSEYQKYYDLFLKKSYVSKFKSYTDQKIKILKVRSLAANEYIVETEIVSDTAQPVLVDYKIRQSGQSYRAFDIIAEGVSLITTQRADFDGILSREGIDYLTGRLKARAEASQK